MGKGKGKGSTDCLLGVIFEEEGYEMTLEATV